MLEICGTLSLCTRPSLKDWTAPSAWALTLPGCSGKVPLAVWHFALLCQPCQDNPRGSRFCTIIRMYIFNEHNMCYICLWEQPRCPFKVRLHGLLSRQETRMHRSSPHFSQMLWITPSLRNPGGFPGCRRYSSVCSGAGCTHKSRAVAAQAATAF